MADPATMAIAGAALGAATNKDDPMKGALMGAALGGGGGYLLGGAGGAAAAEGALGAEAFPIAPGSVPEIAVLPDQAYLPTFGVDNVSTGFDYDAIARASMGSDIPGASAVSGSSAYNPMRINPMMAMSALNMMGQQQPQMAGGGVRRGNPQLVQQDAIQSLLAPKRVQKRQISLL